MALFGERLREHREQVGMSQRALAQRARITASHLSRIEHGTRPPPRVANLLRMIEALRLDRDRAVELTRLAGYSPNVLEAPTIGFSAPTLFSDYPSYEDLIEALEKYDLPTRQRLIEALLALIEAVGTVENTSVASDDASE